MIPATSATAWSEAAGRLAGRLQNMVAGDQIREGAGRWLNLTESELPPLDLLRCLDRQQTLVKFYWQDRERQYEVASVGAADIVGGKNIRFPTALLPPAAGGLSYFGGSRFDHSYPENLCSDSWKDFGDSLFILPLVQMQRNGNSYSISCNLDRTASASDILSDIVPELLDLSFDTSTEPVSGAGPYRRNDRPDHTGWAKNIESALKMFERGEAQKVVLGRETILEFEHVLSPWQTLERLRADSSSCYLFGFQPVEATAFIGASPERLYRRRGRQIETEAMAGTRPRGANEQEDMRLAEELRLSNKDHHEHGLVVESILKELGELCLEVANDPSSCILKLSRVQHLSRTITGTLKKEITDSDLLARLHPTPAVGGFPRPAALEAIRHLEGFDRGWYAGPFGRLSAGESEFAVGIRSGLVRGSTLTLYSGAGIVSGSTAEKEWAEIEQKMSGFLEAAAGKPR